jgi:pimeloyl-ACP methyl ester carboxylesterase
MDLLPGVRSQTAATDRLRVHWIESGPADGVPVVLLHGNLSSTSCRALRRACA